ncbi:nucleotidyltransferase family protein [candidate division CSSED10-310 bacterium]|uniref:Nucleotidyltransferase family protein n=1 Tax=candidate division CSSED10-310 bacterium TaxID=2855610 RepID=A0ABV6YUH4_UNCC1
MNSSLYGGYWPTEQQETLLRAALLNEKEALESFESVKSFLQKGYVDSGSQRLLPLLYSNLREQGFSLGDPMVKKLQLSYRETWIRNRTLFHSLSTLVRYLHEAGFQTMLLKGAALTLQYYQDYGLRPMMDFDILIKTEQLHEVLLQLQSIGWEPVPRSPEKFTTQYLHLIHAYEFQNLNHQKFDLHWHVLEECCQSDADDDFWEGAVPLLLDDLPTKALNPSDQLLHIIVHGTKWNPVPPLRWIADAWHIFQDDETVIDWDRLVEQALKRELLLPVHCALFYLKKLLDVPIPPAILDRFKKVTPSRIEILEFRYKSEDYHQKLLGYGPILWFNYRRWRRDNQCRGPDRGFISYLSRYWGVTGVRKMLWFLSIMVLQRIKIVLTRLRK